MSTASDDPCAVCNTNRGCCTLKGWCGLMLTKDEFEKHFKRHAEKLFIRLTDDYVVISTKEGLVCPHLSDSGCGIYQNRPIDCRLFPYVMRFVSRNAKKVKIAFHTRSDCPKKSTLLIPEAEARALVMEFGKKVFGEDKTIIVVREKGPLSRLLIRIEKTISRRRFK
jgi:Fe-S-cluster containining protein